MCDEYGSSQTPPPTFPTSTRPKDGSRDRSSSMLAFANCCIGGDENERARSRSQKSSSLRNYPNDHNRMNRPRQSTILETDIERQAQETIHLNENSIQPTQTSNNTAGHQHESERKEDEEDETSAF